LNNTTARAWRLNPEPVPHSHCSDHELMGRAIRLTFSILQLLAKVLSSDAILNMCSPLMVCAVSHTRGYFPGVSPNTQKRPEVDRPPASCGTLRRSSNERDSRRRNAVNQARPFNRQSTLLENAIISADFNLREYTLCLLHHDCTVPTPVPKKLSLESSPCTRSRTTLLEPAG